MSNYINKLSIDSSMWEDKYPLTENSMKSSTYFSFPGHEKSPNPYLKPYSHSCGGISSNWVELPNTGSCKWNSENFKDNKVKCCRGDYSIQTIDERIDGFQCKRDYDNEFWIPWSKDCDDEIPVQEFCKGKENNKSRLISNTNCSTWCSMNEDLCYKIKDEYCKENINAPECKCYNIINNPYYIDVIEKVSHHVKDGASVGDPMCWVPECLAAQDRVNQLLSKQDSEARKKCSGKDINICEQIINVEDSENINIDDLTWSQVCGSEKPNPYSKDKECVNDKDCSIGDICKNEKCVSTACNPKCEDGFICNVSSNKCMCANDKSCPEEQRCKDGNCVAKSFWEKYGLLFIIISIMLLIAIAITIFYK